MCHPSISLLGKVVVIKEPTDAVEHDGKLTFSCTLNVTSGNDVLRFWVLDTEFSDRLSGCEIDKHSYSKTLCSWPSIGANLTCDYSIPYQITCDLTIVNSAQVSYSTQVSCYHQKGFQKCRFDKYSKGLGSNDILLSNINETFVWKEIILKPTTC